MNKRRYDIDLCRLIACIMVIGMHAPIVCPTLSGGASAIRTWFSYFTRAGVPLFYMLTGALYLGRENADLRKTVRKALTFYLLFVIWSALYLIREQFFFRTYHSFNEFYCALFAGHYHLWFLTSIGSAYLFLPLLHGAINGKKVSLRYIVGLFVLFATVKFNAQMFIPERWLGPFTMLSDDIVPILVFMPLGYLLSKRHFGASHVALLAIADIAAVIAAIFLTDRYSDALPNLMGGTMLPQSLMNLVTVTFVFALCSFISDRKPQGSAFIRSLASLSFGVYLIHPLILDEIGRLEAVGFLHPLFLSELPFLRFPFILTVTAVLSFLLSCVIGRIPVIKKLILK